MADAQPLQSVATSADTREVKLRTSTTELLARAFAESVAAGDLQAAEGWLATAEMVARRQDDRSAAPTTTFADGLFARSRARR